MEIIKSKDAKENFINENRFFEYEKSTPLTLKKEFITLKDEINEDHEVNQPLNLSSTANEDFVRNSIFLWEALGIDLHKVWIITNRFPLVDLLLGTAAATELKMGHDNPENIPVDFQLLTNYPFQSSFVISTLLQGPELGKTPAYHWVSAVKSDNITTTCDYNHEIAHTQMSSTIGSCKIRLNKEVIPFLVEELFAYHLDPSLESSKKERIINLKCMARDISELGRKHCNYLDSINSSTYIQSRLESINLANIYFEGDERIRKEMCEYINQIFKGNRCVEEMLEHYDSQLEAVPKTLEKIKKPFK